MIGEKIRTLRKDSNMSQDDLAEKLNVTRQSISLWENDQANPSLDNIKLISQIFDVSVDYLINIDGNKSHRRNKNNKKCAFIILSIIALFIVIMLIGGYHHRDILFGIKKELSSEKIYEMASPLTVEIQIETDEGNSVIGTGFFEDCQGTIITNYHVLDGAVKGYVVLNNGQRFSIDNVIGYDEELDIAIIKINYKLDKTFTKRTTPIVTGETVYAIGSSEGLTASFSSGIISSTNRNINGNQYIQTTTPISHGNSGGPLVDKYGELIGITSAGIEDGQNLNLVIPISMIDNVSRDKNCGILAFSKKHQETLNRKNELITMANGKSYAIYGGKVHKTNCSIFELDYMLEQDKTSPIFFDALDEALKVSKQKCSCIE